MAFSNDILFNCNALRDEFYFFMIQYDKRMNPNITPRKTNARQVKLY